MAFTKFRRRGKTACNCRYSSEGNHKRGYTMGDRKKGQAVHHLPGQFAPNSTCGKTKAEFTGGSGASCGKPKAEAKAKAKAKAKGKPAKRSRR